MRITSNGTVATVTRTLTIDGDRPLVHPAGYRRPFLVDTVTIIYRWTDGSFEVGSNTDIWLSGHWVNKNGKPAADRAINMWPGRVAGGRALAPEYAFAQILVDLLAPGTDLSMTLFNGHEIEVP